MRLARLWLLNRVLAGISGARKGSPVAGGPSNLLLQALLGRVLRRSPMGFIATLLLQKALRGETHVWGMDLASRRNARMAWLARAARLKRSP